MFPDRKFPSASLRPLLKTQASFKLGPVPTFATKLTDFNRFNMSPHKRRRCEHLAFRDVSILRNAAYIICVDVDWPRRAELRFYHLWQFVTCPVLRNAGHKVCYK